MKHSLKLALFFTVFSELTLNTDAFLDFPLIEVGLDYIVDAVVKVPLEIFNPPSNKDYSIKYLLYTPSNKIKACQIEPTAKQFDKCSFDSSYETKFLIHGFVEMLTPRNLFNDLKNAILQYGNYNVIIVDWTRYNTIPFNLAYKNAKKVGDKVAEMMKFIETHTKVSLKTFHCIGHSLGAHVCGVTGRSACTLARITGLDPGGTPVIRSLEPNIRLNYTDADFVDVIHTSDRLQNSGRGVFDAVGNLDFYPNGGVYQPRCVDGNTYKVFKGKTLTVQNKIDKILCNHFIAIEYFTNSVRDNCKFIATECQNYADFDNEDCQSGTKTEMGFHAKKIEGIKPKTKFFLNTLSFPPYCMDEDNSI